MGGSKSKAACEGSTQKLQTQYQDQEQRKASSHGVSVVTWPGTEINMEDELVAVIVTIIGGSSYDSLFRTVPQLAGEGERVAVYQVRLESVGSLIKILDDELVAAPEDGAEEENPLTLLAKDLNTVPTDSVVFNWECCSSCSDRGFGSTDSHQGNLELIEKVISRGSMVMVSDFSLKALIADWQVDLLGPNPFVRIGEFSNSFTLHFQPEVLKECDSAQLQKVGELCGEGKAESHAMGNTIAYTVDQAACETPAYALEVLTVASGMPGVDTTALPPSQTCSIGAHHGAAGHVILTYPTGGQLLASCGHWVELSKLDVSLESLFQVAEQNYGAEYVSEMRSKMTNMSDGDLDGFLQEESCKMVQQSAPCKYSKSKW